jgi:TPP-dependent pyruvate/acetoin dehydrogenase alpha subunit
MSSRSKGQPGSRNEVTPPGKDGASEGFSLISNDKLIALYANLLKCRMVEERLAGIPDQESTNGHKSNSKSIRGYEAGTVGVAMDLGWEDVICSPNHGLLTGFAGEVATETLLLWSGVSTEAFGFGKSRLNGAHASRSGAAVRKNGHASANRNHSYTQAAIGAALANKTTKNGKVAVLFGDEPASESVRDALHIAAVHALPMIFVIRESSTPAPQGRRSRIPDAKQLARPDTPWFPNINVDSNDVVAVYRVANEAISRARLGRGPTLIECQPFRVSGTSNGNGKHWHDPILNMENYLRGKGLFRAETKNNIIKISTRQLDALMNLGNRQPANPSH